MYKLLITFLVLFGTRFFIMGQNKNSNDLKLSIGIASSVANGLYKSAPTFGLTDYITINKKGACVLLGISYSGVFNPNNVTGGGLSAISLRSGYRQLLPIRLYLQGEAGFSFLNRKSGTSYTAFSYAVSAGYLLKIKSNGLDISINVVNNADLKKNYIKIFWISYNIGYQIKI